MIDKFDDSLGTFFEMELITGITMLTSNFQTNVAKMLGIGSKTDRPDANRSQLLSTLDTGVLPNPIRQTDFLNKRSMGLIEPFRCQARTTRGFL